MPKSRPWRGHVSLRYCDIYSFHEKAFNGKIITQYRKKALLSENVDTLFAYPGGQAIDLFHALYGVEGLEVILPRHEQGLVHAADGYARSTGKAGDIWEMCVNGRKCFWEMRRNVELPQNNMDSL